MTKQELISALIPFTDEVEIYLKQENKAFPQDFQVDYKWKNNQDAYLELTPTRLQIKNMIKR